MIARLKSVFQFVRFHSLHMRSRARIQKWQSARLRKLITYISQHVPLYRELYANIPPSAIRTIDDISLLPVIRKNMLLENPETAVDPRFLQSKGWSHTSGTSGVPFRFLRSSRVGASWYTDSLRYRFLFTKHPWLLNASGVRIVRIKVRGKEERNRLFISVRDFLDDEKGALEKVTAFKPQLIESYTSILLVLAECVVRYGRPKDFNPAYVVSFGEVLTPQTRAFIESALGCEVFDRYGFEEVGPTATECAEHDGMHVHSESLIVEIVDAEGRRVPDGVKGNIVVTDLYNDRMPFIRYDSGDQGILRSDPCPCGEETPRLWVEGRHSAYLEFNGKRIHHLEFDAMLDSFANTILQYQVAKRSEREVVVRMIPGTLFRRESTQDIAGAISKLVGADVVVAVEETARIPLTQRGKCRIIVDESII